MTRWWFILIIPAALAAVGLIWAAEMLVELPFWLEFLIGAAFGAAATSLAGHISLLEEEVRHHQ